MGRICPKCNYERKPTDGGPDYMCPSCSVIYEKVGQVPPLRFRKETRNERQDESPTESTSRRSRTAIIFYALAVLSAVGGILLAIEFSPGDPGYGNQWKTIAYTPSLISFFGGLFQGLVLFAIGKAIWSLKNIELNTRR